MHKFKLKNGRFILQTKNLKENAKGEWVIYAQDLEAISSDEYNEFAALLKQWEAEQIGPDKMATILDNVLTKDEFLQLFSLIDGDGQAGPLWEAIAKKAEEISPETFVKILHKPIDEEIAAELAK